MERVLILGGGVGGTLTANLLVRRLPDAIARDQLDVTLVDAAGTHVFQPGFMDIAIFGEREEELARPERSLLDPEVGLLVDRAVRVDPRARTVTMASEAVLPYDYLVLATGSRIAPEEVEHFDEAHHFYSAAAARRLRDALDAFAGGRIVIGIVSVPYKSPHAPLEVAFLIESELRERGLRDRTTLDFCSPIGLVIPIEEVAEMAVPMLAERGIELHTSFRLRAIDRERKVIRSDDGQHLGYDLLVLVPPHRGQQFLIDSGLAPAPGGWLPTDPQTLRVRGQRDVWAIGDATDLPVSKAGSAAHFQSPVVAEGIVAALVGRDPQGRHARYDGRVLSFLEVGDGRGTMFQLDDEHPAHPGTPNPFWHWGRAIFKKTYFHTVPRGRV